jgi:hypothetical protein
MKSTKYTVTTTAQIVVPAKNFNLTIYLHVLGAGTVYLGDAAVTTAAGFLTEKNANPMDIFIPGGETVYAIVGSGTEDVRVLDWTN